MLDLYRNIKRKRLQLGITQSELAKKIGYSDKSMIAKIESGKVDLTRSKIIEFAKALETSPSTLMGWDDNPESTNIPIPNAKGVKKIRLPKLGVTAAGEPIFAEYTNEYVEVDFDIRADFTLDVKGDSMAPDIQNGDIIFVRSQPDALNGQLAVVMIDGEVTLKVFYKDAHAVTLMPKNAAYPPIVITDTDERDVRILGIVVRSCRNYV